MGSVVASLSTRGTGRRVLEQEQVARRGSNGFPFGLFGIPAILFGLFCLFVAIHTPSYTPTPAEPTAAPKLTCREAVHARWRELRDFRFTDTGLRQMQAELRACDEEQ